MAAKISLKEVRIASVKTLGNRHIPDALESYEKSSCSLCSSGIFSLVGVAVSSASSSSAWSGVDDMLRSLLVSPEDLLRLCMSAEDGVRDRGGLGGGVALRPDKIFKAFIAPKRPSRMYAKRTTDSEPCCKVGALKRSLDYGLMWLAGG